MLDGEGSAVHQIPSQQQDLGQYKQYQKHGKNGAPAQTLADSCNGAFTGHLSDQDTGNRQDQSAGQNRWKSKVQRFDNGVLMAHLALDFLIAACNYDGIVNVGAHLNG